MSTSSKYIKNRSSNPFNFSYKRALKSKKEPAAQSIVVFSLIVDLSYKSFRFIPKKDLMGLVRVGKCLMELSNTVCSLSRNRLMVEIWVAFLSIFSNRLSISTHSISTSGFMTRKNVSSVIP